VTRWKSVGIERESFLSAITPDLLGGLLAFRVVSLHTAVRREFAGRPPPDSAAGEGSINLKNLAAGSVARADFPFSYGHFRAARTNDVFPSCARATETGREEPQKRGQDSREILYINHAVASFGTEIEGRICFYNAAHLSCAAPL